MTLNLELEEVNQPTEVGPYFLKVKKKYGNSTEVKELDIIAFYEYNVFNKLTWNLMYNLTDKRRTNSDILKGCTIATWFKLK